MCEGVRVIGGEELSVEPTVGDALPGFGPGWCLWEECRGGWGVRTLPY